MLFIIFLLFLSCWAKSFKLYSSQLYRNLARLAPWQVHAVSPRCLMIMNMNPEWVLKLIVGNTDILNMEYRWESTIDNEKKSHAIKVTPSGLINDKDSNTIYIENDDILSISEFSKLNNPEEYHFINLRFIKETNNDYIRKVRSKNNKSALEIPKLEEFNVENKTDRNVDATTVASEEESRRMNSEELSTETNEIESTTISITGYTKTDELIEGYEHLEIPENIESTEGYLKVDVSNDDDLDVFMTPIPSRRSLFPNEKEILDYTEIISTNPVKIVEVGPDTVSKSEMIRSKNPDEQGKVESTTETLFVAPHPVHPYPDLSHQKFPNLSPLVALKKAGPAGLRKISNQETTNFGLVKMAPDKHKQSNNLHKSGEPFIREKTRDDFNSNIFENSYLYTPSNIKNMGQQPLTKQPNFNTIYSKLTQASEHPFRNRLPGGQTYGNYVAMRPNVNPQNRYLPNVGVYNFVPRLRRFLSCNYCGQKELKRV